MGKFVAGLCVWRRKSACVQQWICEYYKANTTQTSTIQKISSPYLIILHIVYPQVH